MDDHRRFDPENAHRLNNPARLKSQVSEEDLLRLLDLRGTEDLADLGSGTGFYTDLVAKHTTGVIYALELSPRMNDAYRQRGVPANVHLLEGDIRDMPLPANSIDTAYSIVTLHETAGDVGMSRLLKALRDPGRVVMIDWRTEPASWQNGPPPHLRLSNTQAAQIFRPFFETVTVDNLGGFMFALVADGKRRAAADS